MKNAHGSTDQRPPCCYHGYNVCTPKRCAMLEKFYFKEFVLADNDYLQLFRLQRYGYLCKLRLPKVLGEILSHGQLAASMNTGYKQVHHPEVARTDSF